MLLRYDGLNIFLDGIQYSKLHNDTVGPFSMGLFMPSFGPITICQCAEQWIGDCTGRHMPCPVVSAAGACVDIPFSARRSAPSLEHLYHETTHII